MSTLDTANLIEFFGDHPEKPWHVQDVQKHFGIEDRAALKRALDALVDAGSLVRTRRRAYGLPQEMNLVPGRLQVASGGYGFVIRASGEGRDLFIPADRLGAAWDGDRVLVRVSGKASEDGRQTGEIVRIVERSNDRIVGTLEYARGYAILRPDSPRLRERILLTPESVGRLDAGLRIVARMIWPEDSGEHDPFGEVVEVLGEQDDPDVETRAVIVNYDLKDAYDDDTLAEAAAVPDHVTGSMMEGRTDMRDVPTFTIDGADAKDFDDALSVERIPDKKGEKPNHRGMLRVGVHIADVSYYVAEGTSLDTEAMQRATSVYLPGKVLPMLPEQLSNGICSLVEGHARLALSVLVDVTREGEVHAVKFKETVITSDARLTYEQVQAFAEGDRLPSGKRKLERDVKVLLNLTRALRDGRLGAGALNFDFTEAKVDVDEEGALHLQPIRSNAARQLVEELMLLANRLVAEELQKRDVPALYRVHEDPSEAKIEALQKALARLGYELDLAHASPMDLQKILRAAAGKPEANLVNTLLLRSLKQARYAAENLGHFGLAFANYLHFTSPIRRYPDLVVHRAVRAMLQHRLSPTLKERMRSDFPDLAAHASERERQAEKAERDLAKYYYARWARDHVGEAYSGVISGVTGFGVFVSLPNGVEGLMHVSHLDDDYYVYLEDSLSLLGKSSRKSYRMGDRVDVRIYQANPTARQIDLVPKAAEMPESTMEETPKRHKAPKSLKTPVGGATDAPSLARPGRAAAPKVPSEPQGKGANKERPAALGATAPRADRKGEPSEGRPTSGRGSERTQGAQAKNQPTDPATPAPPARPRRRLVFGRKDAWS